MRSCPVCGNLIETHCGRCGWDVYDAPWTREIVDGLVAGGKTYQRAVAQIALLLDQPQDQIKLQYAGGRRCCWTCGIELASCEGVSRRVEGGPHGRGPAKWRLLCGVCDA